MMGAGNAGWSRDAGLSEVVGFVMIIGMLTVAASLYLAYGVPAMGRENEILHMNEVKDQFVNYKLSLDTLYDNDKVDTSVGNAFTLGTSGGYSQGSINMFFPVMNPVNAGGIMAVNQRTSTPETLNISSYSLILDPGVRDVTHLPAGVPTVISNPPQNLYVNLSGIQSADLSATNPGYYGTEVKGTGWTATVNLTPQLWYYPTVTQISISQSCAVAVPGSTETGASAPYRYCMNPTGGTAYNGTDISVTVYKGSTPTIKDLRVFRGIAAGGTYAVDLMDGAYGLGSSMKYPDTITLANTYTKNPRSIVGSGNATYGYRGMSYVNPLIPLGAVEFRSVNNYWISQEYYYQAGGVFLAQDTGNSTYKLPPRISFSKDSQNIVTVKIDALTIDPDDAAIVGGTSHIQMKSRLTNITPLPYATTSGNANTKWIRIGVNTSDIPAQMMWKNYFDATAGVAGIPNFETGTSGNESYILINGQDTSMNSYDINVIASEAIFSALIHGAGASA